MEFGIQLKGAVGDICKVEGRQIRIQAWAQEPQTPSPKTDNGFRVLGF